MSNFLFSEIKSARAGPASGAVRRGDFAHGVMPWPGEMSDEWEMGEERPGTAGSDAAAEQQLIRMAISRGPQAEGALTNMVFFRRHPQRRGRRLRRGEPDFEALRREWLTIRDRLVRPMLGPNGVKDLYDRAERFFQRKQYDRAILLLEHMRNYPGLDPKTAHRYKKNSLYNLGQINRELKRFAAAVIYYENYLALPELSDQDRLKAQEKLDQAKWGASLVP